MPIFVWIYRITWIRDKAGFFFIFLIFLFNWYNCYLKSTRTWTKLYMHINIQVQNLGKIQSSLSKNFISKMFLSNPTKNIWSKGWISLLKLIFTRLNFWNYSWSTKCSISSMVIEKLIKCTWQEQISQMKVRRKGMQKSLVYKSTLKNPMLEEPWFDFLKKSTEKKARNN